MNGKILLCTWGATMVLQKFAEVIKETPKTILVRELKNKTVENTGFLRMTVVPDGVYLDRDGKENHLRLYKDPNEEGVWFTHKHGFYQNFREWDGQPKEEDHAD